MIKLSYEDLISPCSLKIKGIGSIKSPKLTDIRVLGYEEFRYYIALMTMTIDDIIEGMKKENKPQESIDSVLKMETMWDLVISDGKLNEGYKKVFSFFLEEEVIYLDTIKKYLVFTKKPNEEVVPCGQIDKDNFEIVRDIILQRCDLGSHEEELDESKAKNKAALNIMRKIKNGLKKKSHSKEDLENHSLGNIISVVSNSHPSLNTLNIWDITIFNLYDSFKRLSYNMNFEMQKMSVSVWGDKENHFDLTKWFSNIRK